MTFFQSKTFWLAKDSAQSEQYQDAFALDERRGIAAIADGVSSSLFSAPWAKILTDAVVASPPDVHDANSLFPWLDEQRAKWDREVDTENLAWHQKAKLQQGAQSTLLWTRVLPPDERDRQCPDLPRLHCFAIGDCCLLHARGSQMLRAFPIEASAAFEENPRVLTSIDGKHDQTLAFHRLYDYCEVGDLLILCTDAIGAWAIKQLEEGATMLWRDFWDMGQDDWAAYIGRLREDGRMRYDDATMVILRICQPPGDAYAKGAQIVDEAKKAIDDVTETISGFFSAVTSKRK